MQRMQIVATGTRQFQMRCSDCIQYRPNFSLPLRWEPIRGLIRWVEGIGLVDYKEETDPQGHLGVKSQ